MAEIVDQRRQHHFERAKQMLWWFNDYTSRPNHCRNYAAHLLDCHFTSVDHLIDKELSQ